MDNPGYTSIFKIYERTYEFVPSLLYDTLGYIVR